jgi:hypothetical protein
VGCARATAGSGVAREREGVRGCETSEARRSDCPADCRRRRAGEQRTLAKMNSCTEGWLKTYTASTGAAATGRGGRRGLLADTGRCTLLRATICKKSRAETRCSHGGAQHAAGRENVVAARARGAPCACRV